MKIKKILGLLSFVLLSSIGIAQTEDISPDPLFMVRIDTMYDIYIYAQPGIRQYFTKKRDIRLFKESNTVDSVKFLITGKIRLKDLDIFKNTLEYWEIKANIRMDENTVLPAVKYIQAHMLYGGLKLFDFAKHTPNLELLSATTSSTIPVLPPKLRALLLRFENSKWDGVLPEAFFNNPTLEAISIGRYNWFYKKTGKSKREFVSEYLPVFLPEIKQDNYTLKQFRCGIDISVPGNIDKLTKLKGLNVLEISFKEVPSEEELKRLSYIDYIVIQGSTRDLRGEEALAHEEKVKLLIQRLGKKIVYQGTLENTILH